MVNKTLERRESLYRKVVNANIDIDTLNQYNKTEWNKALGTRIKKQSSLDGQKRLLQQIKNDISTVSNRYIAKKKITNPNIKKAIKSEGKRLFRVKKKVVSKKKVQKKLFELKEGSYITTVIYTNDGKKFISASNKKDFNRQLAILDNEYGVIRIGKSGKTKSRKPFITPEFKQLALEKGIKL